MPLYAYTCPRCGAGCESHRTMNARHAAPACAKCSRAMELDFGATVAEQRVDCFQSYVETNFGPHPVEVRSRAHREALCRATGLTYDRMTATKPKRVPWENRMQEYKERAVADLNNGRKVRVPRLSKREQEGIRFLDPEKGTAT